MTAPQVSVVVPVFNEEENISILQSELRAALEGLDFELVFVDDGSSDATAAKIDRNDSRIRLVQFEKNAGQSAATFAGLNAARGRIVALIDGDLQNDPADIRKAVDALTDDVDMVCGYRANRQDTWFKRVQSRIANYVRSRFVKDYVRDTGCGLKAMRRECIPAIVPFKGMHRFVPALVRGAGFRLKEIPVNHRPRQFGESKYGRFGFKNRALRATMDMFGVRWLLSRRLDYKVRND